MATIKKAVKKAIAKKVMDKMAPMMKGGGTLSPSKNSVSKNVGNLNKAKDGASFPDLNKDGKISKADILVGRGVIKAKAGSKMKMGGKMAKQAAIAIAMKKEGKTPKKKMQYGGSAASMVPTSMKKGGMMKMGGKCKNGC